MARARGNGREQVDLDADRASRPLPGPRDETPDERAAREATQPHAARPYILASIHPDTIEVVDLAATLGLVRVAEVIQARRIPHAATYFGKGKVRALAGWVKSLKEGTIPGDWEPMGDHWEPVTDPSGPWGDEDGENGRAGADEEDEGAGAEEEGPGGRNEGAGADGKDEGAGAEEEGKGGRNEGAGADRDGDGNGNGNRGDERERGDPLVSTGGEVAGRGDMSGGTGAEQIPGKAREIRQAGGDPLFSSGGGERVAQRDPRSKGVPTYDPDRDPPMLVLLNDEVKPSVLFNLEEELGVEVWDRTRLILEIFSLHANVKEARLQVELAKLQYEVPLIREAVHRKRSGERPGFMGGGEYGVADYQDFIKRRMGAIKKELEHIRDERQVRRRVRREGFYLVSLAGYTNAGKSSLLNALTGAGTLSRGTLFSTLGTTTRKVTWRKDDGGAGAASAFQAKKGVSVGEATPLERAHRTEVGRKGGTAVQPTTPIARGERTEGGRASSEQREEWVTGRAAEDAIHPAAAAIGPAAGTDLDRGGPAAIRGPSSSGYQRPILLTDTVGFIRALPSWLLEAFHSTLEEISVSDVVLLVADVSDQVDVLIDKVRVCRDELAFLDVTCPVIVVLNKVDLMPMRVVEAKRRALVEEGLADERNLVLASSHTGIGLDRLFLAMEERLPAMVPYQLTLPMDDRGQRALSALYRWGPVHNVLYEGRIHVVGACDPLYWNELDGLPHASLTRG